MKFDWVSAIQFFMLSGVLLFRTSFGYVRPKFIRATVATRMFSTKLSTTLFEDLKVWRKRMSQETHKPLYMILSNQLLETIAMDKPDTLEKLFSLSGFGEKKLKAYGRAVLDMVDKHRHDEDVNFDVDAQRFLNKKIDASFWAKVKEKDKAKAKTKKPVDPVKAEARRKKKIAMLSESAVTELTWPEIALSDLNPEQQEAAAYVLKGNNAFITGSAGTGKTFLLRYVIQELEKLHVEKGSVAITAPTGIAAININGQTIHSFAGIGLGQADRATLLAKVLQSSQAEERWKKCKVLIIDEVSMLSYELFELLEEIARTVRENDLPFGGLQVVMVGDFMQLPPVIAKTSDGNKVSKNKLKFCFQSPVWETAGFNAQGGMQFLRQVERQKDEDFVDFLNQIRVGRLTSSMNALLEQCLISNKPPPDNGIIPTKLYAINAEVDAENNARLQELPGEVYTMTAVDKWVRKPSKPSMEKIFRTGLDNMVPEEIHLKVGAQVMLLRNRTKGQFGALSVSSGPSLVNGSRGKIIGFDKSVLRPDLIVPTVMFDNGVVTTIGPTEYLFKGPAGDGECLRLQIPLKLAWAATVHKSQGCTLTCAELMLDKTFDYGQVYVALSRVKSLAGLWLRTPLDPRTVKAHPAVLKFYGVDRASLGAKDRSTYKNKQSNHETSILADAVPAAGPIPTLAPGCTSAADFDSKLDSFEYTAPSAPVEQVYKRRTADTIEISSGSGSGKKKIATAVFSAKAPNSKKKK